MLPRGSCVSPVEIARLGRYRTPILNVLAEYAVVLVVPAVIF